MRFPDPATGQPLLSHSETEAARREEAAAHREESIARRAAEARVAELEALLAKSRPA